MKTIISTLLVLLCTATKAYSGEDRMPSFYVLSESVDTKLAKTEAVFQIHVLNLLTEGSTIRTATNGAWKTVTLDESNNFELRVEPGTYSFEFYLDGGHLEVSAFDQEITAQQVLSCNLYFDEIREIDAPIKLKKPVVYFHTAIDRPIELTVAPTHKFIFTYPQSDGKWSGIAKSNGDIEIDGVSYPYLFWESEQQYGFKPEENGYKVDKTDAITFLEKKLTELGFTQQEKTDFITFWGPQLAENESSYVQFTIDDNCDAFATMTCSPKPKAVRRVYIQITPWDSYFEQYLNDITYSPIQQTDWYIVEWGGFSFQLDFNLSSK